MNEFYEMSYIIIIIIVILRKYFCNFSVFITVIEKNLGSNKHNRTKKGFYCMLQIYHNYINEDDQC